MAHPEEGREQEQSVGANEAPTAPEADTQESEENVESAEAEAINIDSEDIAQLSETDEAIMTLEAKVAALEDELKRARADLFNLDKEYSNYVRRAKAQASAHRVDGERRVIEAIVSVLDDIAAARSADQLSGPFAAIATKLETSLNTGFGLERFGEAGEEFDPEKHDALMAETSEEVETPTVAQVLQSGYLMSERVLRPAKVMVHNPQ